MKKTKFQELKNDDAKRSDWIKEILSKDTITLYTITLSLSQAQATAAAFDKIAEEMADEEHMNLDRSEYTDEEWEYTVLDTLADWKVELKAAYLKRLVDLQDQKVDMESQSNN